MPDKLPVGKKAPAFSLLNKDQKKVSLKDFLGHWVVVYFYPRDDTPGCTKEACEFTAQIGDFRGMAAQVVGISPDSPAAHRKFADKYKLEVELLSDSDHAVMEKYGAWGEKQLYGKKSVGVIRSTVIVDPAGKVAHHWPNVKAAGHAAAVAAKLTALQAAGDA